MIKPPNTEFLHASSRVSRIKPWRLLPLILNSKNYVPIGFAPRILPRLIASSTSEIFASSFWVMTTVSVNSESSCYRLVFPFDFGKFTDCGFFN